MKFLNLSVLGLAALLSFSAAADMFSGGGIDGDIGLEIDAASGNAPDVMLPVLNFDFTAYGVHGGGNFFSFHTIGGVFNIDIEAGRGISTHLPLTEVRADMHGYIFSPIMGIGVAIHRPEYEQNHLNITRAGWSPVLLIKIKSEDYILVSPIIGSASGDVSGAGYVPGAGTQTFTDAPSYGIDLVMKLAGFLVRFDMDRTTGTSRDEQQGVHDFSAFTTRLDVDYLAKWFGVRDSIGISFQADAVGIDQFSGSTMRIGLVFKKQF